MVFASVATRSCVEPAAQLKLTGKEYAVPSAVIRAGPGELPIIETLAMFDDAAGPVCPTTENTAWTLMFSFMTNENDVLVAPATPLIVQWSNRHPFWGIAVTLTT